MTGPAAYLGTPVRLLGVEYRPLPIDPARAPVLHVVVDTEAEFDWNAPFSRGLTQVKAIAAQERAQAIFRRYGVRPIYAVDFPVATQSEASRPLRAFMEAGNCAIGAHLHPWVNPPFDEPVNPRNSYPGNLPPALEAAKLERLVAAIEASFGIRPRFYKAGRYGIGPATIGLLATHGIRVDFSVLPGIDLSERGGPDFRHMQPTPYLAGNRAAIASGAGVLSLPMTRGQIGPLRRRGARFAARLDSRASRALHLRGLLDRSRLLRQATLTPEGMELGLQLALLHNMVVGGQRVFVMHYHSPSLQPGNTPYVRSAADLDLFLQRIDKVCRYFFEELGGRPGDPAALLAHQPEAPANSAA